jgi:hypothetical protein
MTKSDRADLRSLIRQRFKVLRADVAARGAELESDLDRVLDDRYAAEEKKWAEAVALIEEAAREANRKANDILRSLDLVEMRNVLNGNDYSIVSVRGMTMPVRQRERHRQEGLRRIEVTIQNALLELERQEANLLERLMLDGLESDAAREFLASIPTVTSLVPASRLLELESQFGGDAR